jgi:FkbM family methyltransferase
MSIVDSRYGKFKIINRDSVISLSLRLYGEWAQKEINLLSHFIEPGSVVVDAGAFIGTHTRAFSALVGATGRVLGFEPRKETYGVLVENARLASVENIQVINTALGAAKACVTVSGLCFDDNLNFGSAGLDPIVKKTDKGEKINITSIDTIGLDYLDFIKIDVEGMEVDVLNGAKETVGRFRPVIFAECNSLEVGIPIVQWVRNENYKIYGVLSSAYNQNNFSGNSDNIFW